MFHDRLHRQTLCFPVMNTGSYTPHIFRAVLAAMPCHAMRIFRKLPAAARSIRSETGLGTRDFHLSVRLLRPELSQHKTCAISHMQYCICLFPVLYGNFRTLYGPWRNPCAVLRMDSFLSASNPLGHQAFMLGTGIAIYMAGTTERM